MRKTDHANSDRADFHVDNDLCKGCGLCIHMCPQHVLHPSSQLNRRGFHPVEYEGHGCTGCAICFHTCPEPGGIRIERK